MTQNPAIWARWGTPWVNVCGVEAGGHREAPARQGEAKKPSALCNGNYFPIQTPAWWADAGRASPVLAEV